MPDMVVLPVSMPDAEPSRASTGTSTGAGAAGGSYEEKRAALTALHREVQSCRACGLCESRNRIVFGAGNAEAPVVVIGEAPGHDEDLRGIPFVGLAGQLFTKMLAAIKLDRKKDVFITNVLKCRPPQNRDPSREEGLACEPIIHRQLSIIRPRVILLLGRIAAHRLLGVTDGIGRLRMRTHDVDGIPTVVTYHPAALLRNTRYKRPAWEDLQKLQGMLEEMGVYDAARRD